jgi:hypothetical protein
MNCKFAPLDDIPELGDDEAKLYIGNGPLGARTLKTPVKKSRLKASTSRLLK